MNLQLEQQFDLSGQVALVTGASSGLGAHFAKVLAAAGAKVAVGARRIERLEALVAEIEADGGSALAVPLDVTDVGAVTAAFEAVEQQLGVVSILINNAGVADSGRFVKSTEAQWQYTMDTNLTAVWRIGREAVDRMRKAGVSGSVVNIASILGLHPGFGHSLYATAKAGVVQLTKSMAMESWEHGIRVNALCAGYFETEINADYFQTENGQKYIESIPPKRLGDMSELTIPLLMLVSPAGSFINGIALPVDGGHLLTSL